MENLKSIKEIEDLIIENSQLYYTTGSSNLTDDEFDDYVKLLSELDPKNPILSTTGWGYRISDGEKKKHVNGPICGIPDKVSPDQVAKKMSGHKLYDVTPKYDGVSIISYYEEGRYVGSLTRGDGEYGENITIQVRDKLPKIIKNLDNSPFTGMVRGEFIIKKSIWKMKYAENNKSARNYGAGLLNRKVYSRDIEDFDIIHYNVFNCYKDLDFNDRINFLNYNGFLTTKFITLDAINSLTSIESCKERLFECGEDIYECDGLVVNAYSFNSPEKVVAIKWNRSGIETKVKDILWEQSRLGRFNPTVVVDEVNVSGATIRKASGFNYEYIVNNGVGIGSRITIVRSGEVIPYITSIISKSEDNRIPKNCPSCNSILEIDGVNLFCPNDNCPGKTSIQRIHFIENVCPIDGLGESIISTILDGFEIYTILDLLKFSNKYKTDPIDFKFKLMRFCNSKKGLGTSTFKKACELFEKLNGPLPVSTILVGLGLDNLGFKSVERIFNGMGKEEFWKTLNNPTSISRAGLTQNAINSLMDNKDYITEALNYFGNNIIYSEPIEDDAQNMLKYNIGISITGALSCSRREFLDKCKKFGIEEVSINKAAILITNDPNSGSSKNKDAAKRGTEILTENEFRERFFHESGL